MSALFQGKCQMAGPAEQRLAVDRYADVEGKPAPVRLSSAPLERIKVLYDASRLFAGEAQIGQSTQDKAVLWAVLDGLILGLD